MDNIRLAVPRKAPNSEVAAFFDAVQLQAWVESLPLGNSARSGEELLKALQRVNRTEASISQRYHFLAQCHPLVADLLEALYKQYSTAAVPLAEKQRACADLAHGLLTEMAYGHKAVILAASNSPSAKGTRAMMIASALYATHHLARSLVNIYSIYAPVPKTLWLELHQIYRLAEKQEFLTVTFQQDEKIRGIGSIDHTYRRILMLALANPYHLMQGEALLIFRELDNWASTCRISAILAGMSPNGRLFLDLERDSPPCYMPAHMNITQPGDGRILDISTVIPVLEQRTNELSISHTTESGQLNMAGRRLRNMYNRLIAAWGARTERLSERKQRATPVEIVVGISACHHFASNGSAFKPEITEIELRKGAMSTPPRGLGLTAESDTPWLKEDQVQRLKAGIVQPRVSQFNADPVTGSDIWGKVYSTQTYYEHHKGSGDGSSRTFGSAVCQLRDENRGGMAISCKNVRGFRLIPGEIIGFKSEQASGGGDWSIGEARWLRTLTQDKLEVGIRQLAEDFLPVASRGVKGVGKGGEYLRCLLILKSDPRQSPAALVTPAAIYDVDSVIFVNTGKLVFYAHLTKLLDATNAYSLFQFQIVDSQ
jgi:cyclic-di-GMP-binding protein